MKVVEHSSERIECKLLKHQKIHNFLRKDMFINSLAYLYARVGYNSLAISYKGNLNINAIYIFLLFIITKDYKTQEPTW